jgi:hypothetical protein
MISPPPHHDLVSLTTNALPDLSVSATSSVGDEPEPVTTARPDGTQGIEAMYFFNLTDNVPHLQAQEPGHCPNQRAVKKCLMDQRRGQTSPQAACCNLISILRNRRCDYQFGCSGYPLKRFPHSRDLHPLVDRRRRMGGIQQLFLTQADSLKALGRNLERGHQHVTDRVSSPLA